MVLRRPRAVFDTNILISAWFWKGNESDLLRLVEEGMLEAYTSPELLQELVRVLEHPQFQLTNEEVQTALGYYLSVLRVIDPGIHLKVIDDDPEYDRVLECAVEAETDYVASGNHHMLQLKEFRDIKILPARDLIRALKTSDT